MNNIRTGIGLLVMLVLTGLIAVTIVRYGTNSSKQRRHQLDAIAEEDDAGVPDDVNNPKSVKQHMQDRVCRSNCESTARTCKGVAEADEAKAACDQERTDCLAACP